MVQRARAYPRRAECLDDQAYDEFEASRYHKLAMLYWEAGRRADARGALRAAVDLDPGHAVARRLYIRLSYVIPARLASRLVAGEAIEGASQALGIAAGTARNQLKSIFNKTGARRQPELVALRAALFSQIIGGA